MGQQVSKQYSFEEAFDTVMRLSSKISRMPLPEDYERYNFDTPALARALDENADKDCKDLGVRPYAVINIAVVREIRRRKGLPVFIARANDETLWKETASNLFENRYDDE